MGLHDHETKRRNQTLDELEGIVSGMPGPGDTSLVTKCLRLRKVPIGQFGAEDLRIMIGQREGLMFLVPLALQCLATDPLVEANYFPGDLLCVVLRAGHEFWQRHRTLQVSLEGMIARLADVPDRVTEAIKEFQPAIA